MERRFRLPWQQEPTSPKHGGSLVIVPLAHRPLEDRSTQVYEFFDPRTFRHLWFVAVCDEDSVQMLVPTFLSERAARIFEHCYRKHPAGYLLSIDGQLELGRRIEGRLVSESLSGDAALRTLCEGLAFEKIWTNSVSETRQ